jgi:hypothetical protein
MQQTILTTYPEPELEAKVKQWFREVLSELQPATTQSTTPEAPVKIDHICKTLGVSTVTVHDWKKKGIIPFHRISGKIYFYESEVLAALNPVNKKAIK